MAQTRRRQRLSVSWYGGGRREAAIVTGTAHRYKGSAGLVPIRWVFVEDRTGTHRDEYFFTTDITLAPHQIIEAYTGRWAIEVMFEEVREHSDWRPPTAAVLRRSCAPSRVCSVSSRWWRSGLWNFRRRNGVLQSSLGREASN